MKIKKILPGIFSVWVALCGQTSLTATAHAYSIIGGEGDGIDTAISGDFNGDGKMDIVVCSGDHNDVTPAAADCITADPGDPYDPEDDVTGSDPSDPECDGETTFNTGAVWIFLDGVGTDTPVSDATTAIYGDTEYAELGHSCANGGDFDGDGLEDIVVSTHPYYGEKTYVIMGSSDLADMTGLDSGNVLEISAGGPVAGVGDVDQDGYADIVIGDLYDDTSGVYAGAAYLIYGKADLQAITFNNAKRGILVGTQWVKFTGEAERDYAGDSVAGAGDVNGDGNADFLVGASENDDGGYGSGKAYLVLGGIRPRVTTWSLGRSSIVKFTGETAGDSAGISLAGAGDVNGDGFDDVVIGAYASDQGGNAFGAAFLVWGSSIPTDTDLGDASVEKFIGDTDYQYAGSTVAGVGDVDGNGLDDFLISTSATGEQSAFLVSGRSSYASPVTLASGWKIDEFMSSTDDENFGSFVGPAGDLDGDGTIYFFIGANRNDDGGYGSGKIWIQTEIRGDRSGSVTLE